MAAGAPVLALIAVASAVVIPELLVTDVVGQGGRLVPSPVGVAFLPAAVENAVTSAVAFVALAAAFVGMVRRYRASTAGTRRQYRWVFAAIAFLVVALLIGLVGSLRSGVDGIWSMPILLAYVALPVALMVAILRYRLYEIDRLIRRTVTYSVVTLVGALSDVVSRTVHPTSNVLWIRPT